jgi:hypothetical protein
VDARHRARARCENWIKKLKNAGLGKLPFTSFAAKRAWALNLTAPPAWLQVAAPKRARRDRGPHPRRGRERPRPAAGPREGPIRKGLRRRLQERGVDFTAGIRTAALDSFRGYTNAIRDELPEALTVLDAFHVVKLGSAVVDEVRRRIQQDTLGRRGRKGDPLFRVRRTLQIGAEPLTDKEAARLDAKLATGDPDREVARARQCYQKLRNIYHARIARGFYRLRCLLAADGHRPYRTQQINHA